VKRENVGASALFLCNILTFNRLTVFVMRFAIFSDIHSNLEALEAVVTDARERRCTHFVCLGDVVGYNASPRECIERVRELDCPVVKGNHDEQAAFPASSERFNELAERAINWTREHLSEQDKEWLRSLPLQRLGHWIVRVPPSQLAGLAAGGFKFAFFLELAYCFDELLLAYLSRLFNSARGRQRSVLRTGLRPRDAGKHKRRRDVDQADEQNK